MFNKEDYDRNYQKENNHSIKLVFNYKNQSDKDLHQRLEFYSKIKNISYNSMIKEAITEYLEKHDA